MDNTEAIGTTTMTTIKLPSNFVDGDKLIINSKTGNNNSPEEIYTIHKDSNGVVTVTNDNGGAPLTVNGNAVKYLLTNLQNGEETVITAKVTGAAGDMSATSPETKAQLAPLSEAGLSVSIAADRNDDGVISRDESGSNTSKVKVSIPGNVIKGDKIDVETTNPDNYQVTKHYEVDGKDVNGNITLKEVGSTTPIYVSADHPLELDAAIAVGKDTVAKVTLRKR